MNHDTEALIPLLCTFWTEDYARNTLRIVRERHLEPALYELAAGGPNLKLSKKEQEGVAFRSAYVLEHLLQEAPALRESLRKDIYRDFPTITNESAKRHFCNILLLLMKTGKPEGEKAEKIVEACMSWIEKPGTKIAVLVNAFDVILALQSQVDFIAEMIPDLLFLIRRNSTPGIESRIRKWKKLYGAAIP